MESCVFLLRRPTRIPRITSSHAVSRDSISKEIANKLFTKGGYRLRIRVLTKKRSEDYDDLSSLRFVDFFVLFFYFS